MFRYFLGYTYFILFLLFSTSCASKKPFAETNKVYEKQVDSLSEVIKQPLPAPQLMAAEEIPIPDIEGKRKDLEWVGTVNFNMRKPNFVIIHHTAQDSIQQTLNTFTLSRTQVSAHYVIDKKGKVYQLLNDYLRAWHAGNSRWGSVTDLNSVSLGIEMDNNGIEPYTDAQIENLLGLLDTLKTTYNIPTENFIGHGDIAPGRKVDPGINFPWKRLAEKGFGLWYDDTLQTAPTSFNPLDGLRILGYDTRNPPEAIKAFKRHYIQTEVTDEWNPFALDVLYNLYLKKTAL
ncbi:hypothetical protein GCM10023231_37450 [Olivibacter ginsenosidimutans]|uniref:N-acetylmuramoyl-L-alanine amidase n=1 Tax=Olivibacter ginsenosidimutans TaxID=1176537 RepID=A0ABP9C593_9SPHI